MLQQLCYKNDSNNGNINTNNNDKKNTNTITDTSNNKNNRVIKMATAMSNDSDKNSNNNNRYQNRFCKSSPYYNSYKSSNKSKAKRYFRHSLQRSVAMTPFSSRYFSNSFLSVKGLMGQFCQSM